MAIKILKAAPEPDVSYELDLRKWSEPHKSLRLDINPVNFAIHYLLDLHTFVSSKDVAGLTELVKDSYG